MGRYDVGYMVCLKILLLGSSVLVISNCALDTCSKHKTLDAGQ